MVEGLLLAKTLMVIKGFIWTGYGVAGTYFGATGIRYVKDYKTCIENENREAVAK